MDGGGDPLREPPLPEDAGPVSDEEILDGGLPPIVLGETANRAGILSAWWPRAELNFWSVQGRHEVDFVANLGRRCVAIEVKAGSRFRGRELSGLKPSWRRPLRLRPGFSPTTVPRR